MVSNNILASYVSCSTETGFPDNKSSCILSIYPWIPAEKDKTIDTPIIPIEPAKATIEVLFLFKNKFLNDKRMAVPKDILAFSFSLLCEITSTSLISSSSLKGFESSWTSPSNNLIILVEYFSAKSGLWVTIITNLSLAISFINSIIWTDVTVSNAPVGSSASKISGSFTKALAIATRWHCPPDNWFGILLYWSCKPTLSRAFFALSWRSFFEIPAIVRANSTLPKMVWWGIKL